MPYIETIALFTYTNSDEAPAAKLLAAFDDKSNVCVNGVVYFLCWLFCWLIFRSMRIAPPSAPAVRW